MFRPLIYQILVICLFILNHSTVSTSDDTNFQYCDRENDLLCGNLPEENRKTYSKENQWLQLIKSAADTYVPCSYTNCSCYQTVLDNDLSRFSKGITSKMIQNVQDRGVKYQIVSNKLYRAVDCMFPSRCSGVEYFLLQVVKDLPDMEMIINVRDYPQVSKYSSSIGPVLSFSKVDQDYLDIMYPAWSFREGGPAIKLYPTGIGRWDKHRFSVTQAAEHTPWGLKESRAFFRGSRTSPERDPLIRLSRRNPNLVDAKYTKNQAWKSKADTLGENPAPEVSLEEHCKFKYLFNYRGVAASFRLKFLFLCKSLVFHVGDQWLEFFYPMLKPWYHYIPVEKSATEKELEALVEFVKKENDIVKRIAENGYSFIWEHLKMGDVTCYWRELLRNYAKLLKFKVKLDKNLKLIEFKYSD